MQLRRLFPDEGTVSIDEATTGLAFGEQAPAERPFIALNMVSSADGKATVAGRTAPMSAEADRELFHHLRTQADGILVGAGTVRLEGYGKVTKTDELRAKRERSGVRPDALAVVVSASGQFPPGIPLFEDPDQEVVVIPDVVDGLLGLREQGVRSLLCEGGPTLNSTLFANGLVDELFLTLAPTVAGSGEALTIVEGAMLPHAVDVELMTVHEAGGHLFMHYRVR